MRYEKLPFASMIAFTAQKNAIYIFDAPFDYLFLRDLEDGGSDTEQQSPLWVLISDSEIRTTAQQQQQHWGGAGLGRCREFN